MLEGICVCSGLSSREFCSRREKANKPDCVKPAQSRGVPSRPWSVAVMCCTASPWCSYLAKGKSRRGINNQVEEEMGKKKALYSFYSKTSQVVFSSL